MLKHRYLSRRNGAQAVHYLAYTLAREEDDFHDTNPAGLSLEAATLLEL